MRLVDALDGSRLGPDAADGDVDAFLRDRYGERLAVRVNLVTSLTGAAAGSDGSSTSLSGRTDRRILAAIRRSADAVVMGAATVRAEGRLGPMPGALVIVTRSGDLRGHALDARRERILIACPAPAVDDVARRADLPGAEIVGVEGADLDAAALIAALDARGLASVVCEGGPTLAGAFARAGLVDEFCVTVSPRITPVGEPFISVATTLPLGVVGHLTDADGFSYLRLRPATTDPGSRATS